jgi:hypothetical protein
MDHFNFAEIKQRIEQSNREIMTVLANQAQNYFVKSFRNQGFDGKSWDEVKRRQPGTPEYKYPKSKGLQRQSSPILVGAGYKSRGGTLRRAVSNMARTAEISTGKVKMIVDLPYAKIQNEGGTIHKSASERDINFKVNFKTGKSRFATDKKANFQQHVKIGAHDITIPKRQFIGQTQELTDMQGKKITQIIDKIWKK